MVAGLRRDQAVLDLGQQGLGLGERQPDRGQPAVGPVEAKDGVVAEHGAVVADDAELDFDAHGRLPDGGSRSPGEENRYHRASPPEASLQAFAPHRYPTTPGFCMLSYLSETRDMAAAKAFLRSARSVTQVEPEQVTTDGHTSYPKAIADELGTDVDHRTSHTLSGRLL